MCGALFPQEHPRFRVRNRLYSKNPSKVGLGRCKDSLSSSSARPDLQRKTALHSAERHLHIIFSVYLSSSGVHFPRRGTGLVSSRGKISSPLITLSLFVPWLTEVERSLWLTLRFLHSYFDRGAYVVLKRRLGSTAGPTIYPSLKSTSNRPLPSAHLTLQPLILLANGTRIPLAFRIRGRGNSCRTAKSDTSTYVSVCGLRK